MADAARIENALRKAHAAGDTASAKALASALKQARSIPAAAPAVENQPASGSLVDAGVTWLENAITGIPVVGPAIQRGSDYLGTEVMGRVTGQDPAAMREGLAQSRDQRNEQYPMTALSGSLAGGLGAMGGVGAIPGGARALGITGGRLMERAGRSAVSSGAISGADAVARGQGGEEAAGSAAIGAGVGGAIPVVGAGIGAGARAVADRVYPTINAIRNPSGEASRRVGLAVNRDRAANPGSIMSPADEAVAQANNVPVINADRGGETTRALARSVANQSPEARAVIENTASDRFAGQGQRATEFIRRVTGGAVDDIGYQQAIRDTARYVNRPAYNRAFEDPRAQSMWHEGFEQLMQAPAMQRAAMQATTRGANRAAVEGFQPIRNPFEMADGRLTLRQENGRVVTPTLQFWDQVKRNLDGMIGKAQRAGDNALSGDLTALRGQLVETLDQTVPAYQTARRGAASYFGAEDAIEAGKKFANSPRLVPETRRALERFSPAEKAGFATGYASELIDRIKASGDRTNVINQVFKTQASRESMEMVFGPQKMREIEAYVRVEDLVDRLRGAMGNSTTARQLMELGIGGGAGFAFSGGDWTGALAGAVAARGARAAGQRIDNNVMRRVAELLTSDSPRAVNVAIREAAKDPAYMAAIERYGMALALPARTGAVIAAQ